MQMLESDRGGGTSLVVRRAAHAATLIAGLVLLPPSSALAQRGDPNSVRVYYQRVTCPAGIWGGGYMGFATRDIRSRRVGHEAEQKRYRLP